MSIHTQHIPLQFFDTVNKRADVRRLWSEGKNTLESRYSAAAVAVVRAHWRGVFSAPVESSASTSTRESSSS